MGAGSLSLGLSFCFGLCLGSGLGLATAMGLEMGVILGEDEFWLRPGFGGWFGEDRGEFWVAVAKSVSINLKQSQ